MKLKLSFSRHAQKINISSIYHPLTSFRRRAKEPKHNCNRCIVHQKIYNASEKYLESCSFTILRCFNKLILTDVQFYWLINHPVNVKPICCVDRLKCKLDKKSNNCKSITITNWCGSHPDVRINFTIISNIFAWVVTFGMVTRFITAMQLMLSQQIL